MGLDSGHYSEAVPTHRQPTAQSNVDASGGREQPPVSGERADRQAVPAEHLVALLDSAGHGVLSVDRACRCRFINRAGAALLGCQAADLIGRDISALLNDRRSDGAATPTGGCALVRALHSGKPQPEVTETFRWSDKAGISLQVSSWPIIEHGRVTGAAASFRLNTAASPAPRVSATAAVDAGPSQYLHDALYARSLFQGLEDGILIADREGSYLDANPAACTLLGYTRDELLRMRIADVVTAGSSWTATEYARFLREGGWRGELELRRKDGTAVAVEARASVIQSPFGPIYASVLGDITERRAAEARLREEAQTIETLHRIGITLSGELELERIVQAVTDAATELTTAQFGSFFYNVTNEQGEAYTLYALSGAPREAFERFPMPRNTHVFGPTFRGEAIIRLDDVTRDLRYGQNAPYYGMPEGHLPVRSYLAVPVISRSGEVIGGLFFGHSAPGVFTARHERIVEGIASQAAIAIDNARLLARAQQAARQREEFLSIASHELKTPLTTVKGYSQMLRRLLEQPHLSRGRLEAVAERLVGQSERLEMLIADLLDMSRIQRGRLQLRLAETDLVALSQQAVRQFQETIEPAARHRLIVEAGGPLIGRWDPERLEQILANLLSNAVKYSPAGGDIVLRVRRDGDLAELSVRDHGVGIAPEEQEQLFQPFIRGSAGRTRASGTGLGLYITRLIAEQHGGSVSVRSQLNVGSTFTVRLPLAPPDTPGDQDAAD